MEELYLRVFSDVSENGTCYIPLETLIVLFLYENCDCKPLLITLVVSAEPEEKRHGFKIELPNLLFEVVDYVDVEAPANLCRYPVIVTNEGTTCVAGMCAVLRHVLRIADAKHPWLGFKQGSLCACTESSVWTRFCEVDIIETVNDLFAKKDWSDDVVNVPRDLARFEVHMRKPVKAHNIQKLKQDLAREEGFTCRRLPDSRLDVIRELDHTYSEGHKMTLADLVLLPCFHLVFRLIGSTYLREVLPLTYKWYDTMMADEKVQSGTQFLTEVESRVRNRKEIEYFVPDVPDVSLYRSERKVPSGKKHLYTKQDTIDKCFDIFDTVMDSDFRVSERVLGHDIPFEWSSVPFEIHLEGSEFPGKRLNRKSQQLENMVRVVLKVARKGDRIVDFCSGSGYLGLIIAHQLPDCVVVLLENKEESLKRAQDKAARLRLPNVVFCRGNLDYFNGDFDVGMSLHACGVATDLVIDKCMQAGASFVCCPCCYGSIQPNHVIDYPRSERFRDSPLTANDYYTLAHSSDQTHDERNDKTNQGKRCMLIIDTDRCLAAREKGYDVTLSTMEPPTCSPKNNVLVGIRRK